MHNHENGDIGLDQPSPGSTIIQPIDHAPEAGKAPEHDVPAPKPANQPRNQHLKVDEPKNRQFSARCTESEYRIIQQAMAANGCTDIVRLMLYSINLHKQDLLTPFKAS